jgi:DNA excision repair protein ERCC-6-like
MRTIPSRNRIVLTGTPLQNNLGELWALFDYSCDGELLGTKTEFRSEFEDPIVRATERDASPFEAQHGAELAEKLRQTIRPYFLRRTKVSA